MRDYPDTVHPNDSLFKSGQKQILAPGTRQLQNSCQFIWGNLLNHACEWIRKGPAVIPRQFYSAASIKEKPVRIAIALEP